MDNFYAMGVSSTNLSDRFVTNRDYQLPSKLEQKKRVEIRESENIDSINHMFGDATRMRNEIRNLVKNANFQLDKLINSTQIKRDYLTVVKIYAIFLKIGEIDNVKERFQADVLVISTWEDNTIETTKFDPKTHWKPEIYIENAVSNTKQEISYKIEKQKGSTFVIEYRTVKSIFWEKLELQSFPLDIQDISTYKMSLK